MDIILKYFPHLTEKQVHQFAQLQPLYTEWNAQINVISRKDIDSLYEKHVLHSLAIHKFLQFKDGTHILDIGTGGGFPGIPLAILLPNVQFVLSDSIGKKIKVVQEIATQLELKNITAMHQRAEEIKTKFDFIVSRAVAEMKMLLDWSNGKFLQKQINAIPNGIICLKGGDLKDELKGLRKGIELYELSLYFKEEFFETKKLLYVPMV